MGCGQGRDAIPLARLGYDVLGLDSSKVGIEQMEAVARKENIKLRGQVCDIYAFNDFEGVKAVLFDSIFHFLKKDLKKETDLIYQTIKALDVGCIIAFCIPISGKKLKILNEILATIDSLERLLDKKIKYVFHDKKSNQSTEMDYQIVIVKKKNV